MKKILFAVFSLLLINTACADIFAPFVSRIKAQVKQNSVVLTWQDSTDVSGMNIVYRSKQEIKNSNLKSAERIAEIPMGKQTYTDYPPDATEYFYAILITGENGISYNYIIPFRNALSASVRIASAPAETASAAETAENNDNQVFSPFVSKLKASSGYDSVTLRWSDSVDVTGRNIIYRSEEEITNNNLNDAVKLGEIPMGTETFTDFPPDNKNYYYAVILKGNDGNIYNFIIPFKNSITHPVHIERAEVTEEVLASEEQSSSEVFAPFISRLRASSDKNSILLNWIDSKDVQGRNVIYRYTDEITNTNIEQAERVAEMPMGPESFVDYPPDNREYYYAVLIKNTDGELYDYIIPFRNSTSRPVNIETIAREEDLSTDIKNLYAKSENDGIFISFSSSNPAREVLVYRHVRPITSSEELLKASLVTELPAGVMNYEDLPIAGVPVYYGVFDSGMVKLNNFSFVPGQNITVKPVEITVSNIRRPSLTVLSRPQPLPLLLIDSHVENDKALGKSLQSTLPEYKTLSSETAKMVEKIMLAMPLIKIDEMKPELLDNDKAGDSRGEQYALQLILKNNFLVNDWDSSESELNDFFRTHHSREIEYRAHFYLAQAYYFQGRFNEAFLEFLLVRDKYYKSVDKWIDAVFRKLKNME